MYQLHAPTPILADFIDCFWESAFESIGQKQYEELYVAQYQPNIIFVLSKDYKWDKICIAEAAAVTVNTQAIQFSHLSDNQLFGIRFKAGALRLFSALAMHETTDSVAIVADIFGDKYNVLENKIRQSISTAQRIALAEECLLAQLVTKRLEKFRLAQYALHHIRQTIHSPLHMPHICQAAHVTQRSIDRYFREYMGLSPKKMGRLLRFEQAFKALHYASTDFEFYNFGYYDAAHFSKEFREFVGMNMQTYLNTPFFVQNIQSNHF